MDIMSPFEVASGCDVVEIGRAYPDLAMTGGIDKRVLAQGKRSSTEWLRGSFPQCASAVATCRRATMGSRPKSRWRTTCIIASGVSSWDRSAVACR